ncbi:MAG: hypothetical protein OEV31_02775 [Gammaproteobacteria bacterium]|nr:hypothetical protein [Gammaproteobacteria bacterium]
MNKFLTSLLALTFAAGMSFSVSSMAAKHMNEGLTKACQGKKAGDKVKVDGKEMQCPKA